MANLWEKTWTPKTSITMKSQRTGKKQVFNNGEVLLQTEGFTLVNITVRGKYPNDTYFATVKFEEIVEAL